MPRLRQRILLLTTCAVACFCVYALYARTKDVPDSSKAEALNQAEADHHISHTDVVNPPTSINVGGTKDTNGELRTIPFQSMKTKCQIYHEFRQIDFLQPALQQTLCSDVEAYKKREDGYPMCKLPNPFDDRLLSIVRTGSAKADLMDTKNSPVKMYVYPEKDYISETIRKTHAWEPALVHTTIRFAQQVPNATFLDAGCNIGVYSVLAARLGLPVVSLDANIRNLLRLRLTLSAASLDASLVWNFIGSGDELSYLNFPEDCNVGGATKFGRAVRDTIPVMPVRSDRLCSLIATNNIVLKLDVEGGEADFLRTSGCLFNHFKVAVVQMEWLKRHMVGNDSTTISSFFTSRRYSAWRTPGLSELDTRATSTWGDGDLMWVHQEFRHLVDVVKSAGKK